MPQLLYDAPYIFGIHEPGGEQLMLSARRPGWIAFAEVLGHDPNDWTGVDYTSYSDQGLGILATLNHGHVPDGTIPHSSQYEAFARRVANFVSISRGCRTWVIGNEMNYAIHRPGVKVDWARHAVKREGPAEEVDPEARSLPVRFNVLPDQSREIRTTRGALISPGEVITPEHYARCYRLCREAIHRLPGHEGDLVLVGAVTPWNTQTIYPGNANGDWVQYFQDILTLLGPGGCDGFALHAYTHGADPGADSKPGQVRGPLPDSPSAVSHLHRLLGRGAARAARSACVPHRGRADGTLAESQCGLGTGDVCRHRRLESSARQPADSRRLSLSLAKAGPLVYRRQTRRGDRFRAGAAR